MELKVIGVSGFARSGKDSLATYLINKYKGLFKRFALADELKLDLNSFLKEKADISAFTIVPEEKELIRDMMVAYGKIKRHQTQGRYWTGLLQPKINECIANKQIPIVTDIRYDQFPEDECFWLQNYNRGQLIHITRLGTDLLALPAPNNDEALNNPRLKAKANFYIRWSTFRGEDPTREIEEIVQRQMEGLIIEIEKRYNEFKQWQEFDSQARG